jgi:hypothetical protein
MNNQKHNENNEQRVIRIEEFIMSVKVWSARKELN